MTYRNHHALTDPYTACAHAAAPSAPGAPLVAPLTQSTTFARGGINDDAPHQYSRVSNPTVATLESALARLEGIDDPDDPARPTATPCGGAAAFASGLAAESALFLALLKAGDHAVCARSVYGGTTRLFAQVLNDLGVQTTFVDATDTAEVRAAVCPNTRLIFIETPANPTLDITDIRACAAIANEAGATLAVDNTFLTGALQRPLDLGAHAVVTSTTKFVEGHSTATGGAIITRDPALLARLRFIRKCTGAIQTPFGAWLTLNGLRTLPIRLERQSTSAATVAAWLANREGVLTTRHPSLFTGHQRTLAESQHHARAHGHTLHGAVVTVDLDLTEAEAATFLTSLTLCTLAEHVGSVETLITHPATMTHADTPEADRRAAGITHGTLRLSIGLESPAAIIADLDQALVKARGEQNPAEIHAHHPDLLAIGA